MPNRENIVGLRAADVAGRTPFSSVEVERSSSVRYTDGRAGTSTSHRIRIRASVQPARPVDLEFMPEEMRTRAAVRIYAAKALRVSDDERGQKADRVLYQGEWYEVVKCDRWGPDLLAHHKAIAVRVDT